MDHASFLRQLIRIIERLKQPGYRYPQHMIHAYEEIEKLAEDVGLLDEKSRAVLEGREEIKR